MIRDKQIFDLIEQEKNRQKYGIELIASIKQTLEEPYCLTPIILLTGAGAESRAEEAIEKGAVACMDKPFDIDEFLGMVRSIFNGESPQ